jgi:predicted Zn-dependent protease
MVIHTYRAILIGLVIVISGCTTNAITGRSQLMLVSEQSAISQSESAYNSLIGGLSKSGKLSKDEKLNSRIQEITNRLIAQAIKYRPETKDWKWSVQIIDDPNTVNAFCMAGGKMAIYTGLIDKIKPTDDEIAQVMGHEISHALAKHQAEKMSMQLMTGVAVAVATTSANQQNRQATHDASSLAALALVTLPNSREAETEADRIGIELAAKAGYDPHAAVTLWEKMIRATGQASRFDFLSTHPASPKRMETLASLEGKMRPIYEAAKSNSTAPAEKLVTVIQNSSGGRNINNLTNPASTSQGGSGNNLASSFPPHPEETKNLVKQNHSVTQRLRELNNLRKDGLITEDDFQKKKKELLKEF